MRKYLLTALLISTIVFGIQYRNLWSADGDPVYLPGSSAITTVGTLNSFALTKTVAASTGLASLIDFKLGTAGAKLTAGDHPIVIDHHADGTGLSYGVYIKTLTDVMDHGAGLVVENYGFADGGTFAINTSNSNESASALAAFNNSTTDVADQYNLTMMNTHGYNIINQSKGTGSTLHIRRNGNVGGTLKSGAHIMIDEKSSGSYGHLIGLKMDTHTDTTDTDKQILILNNTVEKFSVNVGGTITTYGGANIEGGGALAGTFTGTPTFNGALTLSGTPSISSGAALAGTFTGTPTFNGALTMSGGPAISGAGQVSLTSTAYDIVVQGVNNGTHTNDYGVRGTASGAGGTTHIGVEGRASGATNNYPFYDGTHGNYSAAGGWTDVSDPKRKTLIRELELDESNQFYNTLDDIKVKGYRYKAEVPIIGYSETEFENDPLTGEKTMDKKAIRDDPKKAPERFGMMANELPDFLSSKNKDGISAGRIAAYLVVIVQHQKKLIEDLTARVEALEAKN